MHPFRVAYLDMNSFFASVEQQINPALRGKPLAITAVETEFGACVAASYEAKAYGIKTGTRVVDARRMCPGITFLPSRHRLYVKFNLAVADVLDRHAELTHIRSVDEFQIALSGEAQSLEGATALIVRLKAAVASEVGDVQSHEDLPFGGKISQYFQCYLLRMTRSSCLFGQIGLPCREREKAGTRPALIYWRTT